MTVITDHKAMGLFRKYLRVTNIEDRTDLRTSMPVKLTVKRYDGQYRTKLIPTDVSMKLVDAYFTKKDDLMAVLEIVSPESELTSDLSDAQYVEIPTKLLGDRLESSLFSKMMRHIGEVTDGEVSKEDVFATPVEKEEYDAMEEFGSWS